jgi:cytidine deaminase
VTVTAVNNRGERRSWTLSDLLPDSFSGSELP